MTLLAALSSWKMPSTVEIYAALYDNQAFFKHWAFIIDIDGAEADVVLHAVGCEGQFRFETKDSNVRNSKSLAELVYIATIPESQVEKVKEVAQNLPIRNDVNVWNCQDYVLDLLDALEQEAILDKNDGRYKNRKTALRGKQDGLI